MRRSVIVLIIRRHVLRRHVLRRHVIARRYVLRLPLRLEPLLRTRLLFRLLRPRLLIARLGRTAVFQLIGVHCGIYIARGLKLVYQRVHVPAPVVGKKRKTVHKRMFVRLRNLNAEL